MYRILGGLCVALLSTAPVFAQSPAKRVLVPVALPAPVPGAHGSLWTTQLSITNTGQAAVLVEGIDPGCTFGLCQEPADIAPGFTLFPIPLTPPDGPGLLLHVGPGYEHLTIALRAGHLAPIRNVGHQHSGRERRPRIRQRISIARRAGAGQ